MKSDKISRREMLQKGLWGLAALGTGSLILRPEVEATPGDDHDHDHLLVDDQPSNQKKWSPTEDNIEGPFYRAGAHFRGKISPPLAQGTVLLVSGRIWGYDTRKPLTNTVVDIWQANHHGRYDNDAPQKKPGPHEFNYRARLITDQRGYYEYETVVPGRYKLTRTLWRPRHIHYRVAHPGYQTLITQLYFKGDPHNAGDQFIKPSLIINLQKKKGDTGQYLRGHFDIVLAPTKGR